MSTTTGYREPGVGYRDGIPYRGQTVSIPVPAVELGEYRFVIADLAGNELQEVQAQNPVWSYVLNDAGTASFTLKAKDPLCTRSLFAEGERELHIIKGTDRVWGGYLWTSEGSLSEDASVRFSFDGWFSRLKRRHVDNTRNYVNEDQLYIAWDLIDYTQSKPSGDLGITLGTSLNSGINRDFRFPFWEMTNIGEQIIAMTELARGFDFEISPDKVFNFYYPSKGIVQAFPYEVGHNISGLSLLEDARDVASTFSVIGAGDGASTCIAEAVDATALSTFGLLETNESQTDIKSFVSLQDRANEGIRQNKKSRLEPQVSAHFLGGENPYTNQVGDRVFIKSDYGWFDIDQQFRIIALTYQLTNSGREAVTVAFDAETDV